MVKFYKCYDENGKLDLCVEVSKDAESYPLELYYYDNRPEWVQSISGNSVLNWLMWIYRDWIFSEYEKEFFQIAIKTDFHSLEEKMKNRVDI